MQGSLDQQLLAAVASEKIVEVAALLKKGADPNTRSVHNGMTPLMRAIADKNTRIASALIAAGADVNDVSHLFGNASFDDGSAIFFARTGPIMKLLLAAGADPNVVGNRSGRTPLQSIIYYELFEQRKALALQLINILLEYGAVPKVWFLTLPIRNLTAEAEALQVFLKAGANIDEKAPNGLTGLQETLNTFRDFQEDLQADGVPILQPGTYDRQPLIKTYILNGATLDPEWIEGLFHPDDKAQILADARWAKLRQILIFREYLKSVGDVPGSSAAASKYFKQGSPE